MENTIEIQAKKYEDHEDCLTAAAKDYAEQHGLRGWDLAPRYSDEQRETILLTVPAPDAKCQCGEYWGTSCGETIPAGSDSRTVEYMPEWLRSSHDAAGNSGSYPANGAQRITVSINCIDAITDAGDEWVREVEA